MAKDKYTYYQIKGLFRTPKGGYKWEVIKTRSTKSEAIRTAKEESKLDYKNFRNRCLVEQVTNIVMVEDGKEVKE